MFSQVVTAIANSIEWNVCGSVQKHKCMKKTLGTVKKTSVLRRLQAQTLPDATLPLGKIPPFTKIAVTF